MEMEKEKEVEQSSSGQTLLVWRPEGSPAWAAACHCEKWHQRLPRRAGSQKMLPRAPGNPNSKERQRGMHDERPSPNQRAYFFSKKTGRVTLRQWALYRGQCAA